jgi:selenide,water dikinase
MLGMPKGRRILWEHGIRVTLIARDVHTPYSGMLPGFVAGHYCFDDIHLDLQKLCRFANVRLLHTSAIGITSDQNIECEDKRPPVRYDAVSIDIGSAPAGSPPQFVTPVKPIAHFCDQYLKIRELLRKHASHYSRTNPFILLVVGGGAGGIELALSVQYSLRQICQQQGVEPNAVKVVLATRGDKLLEKHNRGAQRIFQRVLSERNVEVRYGAEAIDAKQVDGDTNGGKNLRPFALVQWQLGHPHALYAATTVSKKKMLVLSQGSREQPPILFDECLWCTSAGVAPWFVTNTPFDTTDDGFLTVEDTYESTSHTGVFAAGDCCDMVNHPRPKAGVFAVRAGPPLFQNLLNYLLQKPLKPHQPQSRFLGLISTGDPYAIASRGQWFAMDGRFLWTWKDYIDRTWMKKYKMLPDVEEMMSKMNLKRKSHSRVPEDVNKKGPHVAAAFSTDPMRCGGCGAKVDASTVSRVLNAVHQRQVKRAKQKSLPPPPPFDHDDSAIVPIHGGGAMIHTIDYFRSFISDPFMFGKVAAVHALSDVHAMGAAAQTALALAVIPFAADEDITESTLLDLLSGASDVLQDEKVQLVGGHTCEGSELACGFAIHGYSACPQKLLRKSGGKIGDKMVLTKSVGTGALFAADMRTKCEGRHVTEALQSMVQSNGVASRIAREFGDSIHACTDVTGFGLMGHLLEMLVAGSDISAVINIREIPFLQGALDASSDGIYSSLQPQNARNRRAVSNHVDAAAACPVEYPLLFDPQTAGGLLFFVNADIADSFVDKLRVEHPSATIIGEIESYSGGEDDEGVCTIGSRGTSTGKRVRINH